jgi:hypothetical protein
MSEAVPILSTPDPEVPAVAVRTLADELMKVVKVAHGLVAAGRDIDVTGLDQRIGLLCAKMLDLAPDEGRRVRPRLIALSGSVQTLARALTARSPPSC